MREREYDLERECLRGRGGERDGERLRRLIRELDLGARTIGIGVLVRALLLRGGRDRDLSTATTVGGTSTGTG